MSIAPARAATASIRSVGTTIATAVAIVLVVSVLTPPIHAQAEYRVYRVEAENFTAEGASMQADDSASGGRAAVLDNHDSISRASLTPGAKRVSVRAKATTCGLTPRMKVTIGDTVVLSTSVSSKTWTDYSAAADVASGSNVLSVSLTGLTGSTCRVLYVDGLSLFSDVPVNQGIANSVCQPTDAGLLYTEPFEGYSTTSLGEAPGYYEMAPPSGSHAGRRPVGMMILIHGGGWFITGPAAAKSMRSRAQQWRARGWAVISVSSTNACGRWMGDLLWFYDRVHALDPGLPVCTVGESSGGHLAVMVAARRPNLACAISEAGPMDLVSIGDQPAYNPNAKGGQTVHPKWVQQLAIAAFGKDGLAANSPRRLAKRIRGRVLVASADNDQLVPPQQARDMKVSLDAAHRSVRHDRWLLAAGDVGWVHSRVTMTSIKRLWALEDAISSF